MDITSSSKTAIVTGGSSGIGKAVVKKLTKEGLKVVAADITKGTEEEGVLYRNCDVTRGTDVDEMYAWYHENFSSPPEILVLNAGLGIQEKLTEGDPEKWQQVINTNLMGPLRVIRSFVPDMLKEKRGSIIFISSVSANQPHEYGGVYSASKTALEVVAETLRIETLPHLRIVVVSPGIVATSFFENQLSGRNSLEGMDTGSLLPEEIAEDIWYALSKRAGSSINKIITRPTDQLF